MANALMDKLKDRGLLKTGALIGGKWQGTAREFEVVDPATGKVIAHVAESGAAEARRAIDAAQAAFPILSAMTALERAELLLKWEALCQEHLEDLAIILTMEEGKPLMEARGEVRQGLSYLPWFAAECQRAHGELMPPSRHGIQPLTRFVPLGVAAAITPWNFPFSMLPRKLSPALAAGCPVAVKPSKRTPLSALAFLELGCRAGLPAGAINVICGDAKEICGEMAANPLVRKVSFTGSSRIGKELAAACAPTLKRMSLELGGNAPFLVFADAPLEKALDLAMACKFRNAGQTCICANRILVENDIAPEFTGGLVERAKGLKLGNGLDKDTTMGPLITPAAVKRVNDLVQDAINAGAKLLCGGKMSPLGPCFYEPTVLVDVTPEMRIFREEIFGPVASIIKFENEAQAVKLANDSNFGLASYVCTENMPRIMRMFDNLQYGMTGVNDITLASADIPFGGTKDSGMGREGGIRAILEFMEDKYLLLGGLEG